MTIGRRAALRLPGCDVFDPLGHRVGMVGQLFLDASTEQPAWVTVQSGLFGTNERFVPLDGAAFDGDTVTVAVHRFAIRGAPLVALDQGDLPLEEEQVLYLHYGRNLGVRPENSAAGEDSIADLSEYVAEVRSSLRCWAVVQLGISTSLPDRAVAEPPHPAIQWITGWTEWGFPRRFHDDVIRKLVMRSTPTGYRS